jgi:hypothetical protein
MKKSPVNNSLLIWLTGIGLSLLIINLLVFFNDVSVVDETRLHQAQDIPGYDFPLRDTSELKEMLSKPVSNFNYREVNNLIFESLVHYDDRKIQFFENWILWLGGHFYYPLSRTQNPRRIVSGGGGLCSEVVTIFNHIANLNGYETRVIGLNRHVVSEINTPYGWQVIDPDYGVSYSAGIETLQAIGGTPLIILSLENRGYSEEVIRNYIEIFHSTTDNVILEINSYSSPRLYLIELLAEWLKWIIPLVLLAGVISVRFNEKLEGESQS